MSIEQSSVLDVRVAIHAALADPSRLAIVDELVLSDRSPSELRRRLGIESNLMAHHVGVLERAGLVEGVASAGDRRRRYLRLVPDALALAWKPAIRVVADRVVFVCTANSARSQLAAAIWNAGHEVPATSAGTRPADRIHPEAVKAAARAGLDLHGAAPRAIADMAEVPDLVVTVCDRAHEELALRPSTVVLHWSVPDPAEDGTPGAFDATVGRLSTRARTLAPLVSAPRRRSRRTKSHP
jgi:ArsR family transcriptional regulator, arsenate/arsenite/antimonite-responsive transcriptional repressor / arsenate reductase (thioredoxin)